MLIDGLIKERPSCNKRSCRAWHFMFYSSGVRGRVGKQRDGSLAAQVFAQLSRNNSRSFRRNPTELSEDTNPALLANASLTENSSQGCI